MVEANSHFDQREARWTARLEEITAEDYDPVVGNLIKESLEKLLGDEFFPSPNAIRFIEELSKSVYFATKMLQLPVPKFILGSGVSNKGRKYLAETVVHGNVPVFTLNNAYVNEYLANPGKYSGDRISPTALGAHEMFHVEQFLSDPDQFEGTGKLSAEEWDRHPLDRAAQAFGRFFYRARGQAVIDIQAGREVYLT
jgi:hypothetical protein